MSIETSDRVKIVVPGDNPPQIQGSPHLERLDPYGDVALYTDRPESLEEQINRAKDADIIMNTPRDCNMVRRSLAPTPETAPDFDLLNRDRHARSGYGKGTWDCYLQPTRTNCPRCR